MSASEYVTNLLEKLFGPSTTTIVGNNPNPPMPTSRPLPTISPSPVPQKLPTITTNISGYSNGAIPPEYAQMIVKHAKENGIDPALLSALIFNESGFNAKAINKNKNKLGQETIDRGIAQINNMAHPDITDQQAMDPNFAIPWAAKKLKSNIDTFGDVNRGLAAYNVGPGGASIQGVNAYGGGPKGQRYINRVAKNMSPDAVKAIGIKTGEPIWRDKDGNPIAQ